MHPQFGPKEGTCERVQFSNDYRLYVYKEWDKRRNAAREQVLEGSTIKVQRLDSQKMSEGRKKKVQNHTDPPPCRQGLLWSGERQTNLKPWGTRLGMIILTSLNYANEDVNRN